MMIGKEIVILKISSTTEPTQYVYLAFLFSNYIIYMLHVTCGFDTVYTAFTKTLKLKT